MVIGVMAARVLVAWRRWCRGGRKRRGQRTRVKGERGEVKRFLVISFLIVAVTSS
jgi:hypothetical protein